MNYIPSLVLSKAWVRKNSNQNSLVRIFMNKSLPILRFHSKKKINTEVKTKLSVLCKLIKALNVQFSFSTLTGEFYKLFYLT